jgi:hypothetical protein
VQSSGGLARSVAFLSDVEERHLHSRAAKRHLLGSGANTAPPRRHP